MNYSNNSLFHELVNLGTVNNDSKMAYEQQQCNKIFLTHIR